VEGPEARAALGSALQAKQQQFAAHKEAMECMRLDIQMAQERAGLVQRLAEAESSVVVGQHRQAADASIQANTIAAAAPTDLRKVLDASPVPPMLPVGNSVPSQQCHSDLFVQREEAIGRAGIKLFRGNSVAAVWKEWQYGGERDSVKSWLHKGKKNARLTLRGSGRGIQSTKSELSKKRHLPEAVEALIKQGRPESEALRQIDKLANDFGLRSIRAQSDAFLLRHQMQYPKYKVNPADKALQLLNPKDPSTTVKAFDEAFDNILQAASLENAIPMN